METQAAVRSLTETMAKFTAYIGKHLPTDVEAKLAELRARETQPLAKAIYTSMAENQDAANELDRPSCQDTGVIQYFITAGARFPLLGELEDILRNATLEATRDVAAAAQRRGDLRREEHRHQHRHQSALARLGDRA